MAPESGGAMSGERGKNRTRERANRLDKAGRELQRVRRQLKRLASGRETRPPRIDAEAVRALVALRRLRTACLGEAAEEVAWALLLDAFAAHLEARAVPMTSLGLDAGIARSTAHRRTLWLIGEGLLVRRPDPANRRLVLVGLGEGTADRIRAYLSEAARMSPWAG